MKTGVGAYRLLPRQPFILGHELFAGLNVVRILRNAFHRTDLDTLRGLEVADALGAQVGVDLVDLLALVDGVVRTLRFTDITVDAFVGNH